MRVAERSGEQRGGSEGGGGFRRPAPHLDPRTSEPSRRVPWLSREDVLRIETPGLGNTFPGDKLECLKLGSEIDGMSLGH